MTANCFMFFKFYDLEVKVESEDLQIIERLGRDFSYFKIDKIDKIGIENVLLY